jgi:predicted DNA-binding transcriptional regulator AlpA
MSLSLPALHPAMPEHSPTDDLTWRQVEQTFPELAGYGHRLHAWAAAGRFPQPLRLNGRVFRYRRSEIERWLAERRRARA